ncbi:unnamed protein product [Acanthoscelides obtectus]|uniref:Uncharacterized protein n=1 Tax=Acanthoscelides obtectus TaxID=200917 RepID=A0A9P0MMH8_ACAOB|nr:unnamed protein product [Acanthoscelides obtectus]CAK1671593.1 hypothetical protein AOBTE_LOCUS28348 [Acanthoscelides obtectus]
MTTDKPLKVSKDLNRENPSPDNDMSIQTTATTELNPSDTNASLVLVNSEVIAEPSKKSSLATLEHTPGPSKTLFGLPQLPVAIPTTKKTKKEIAVIEYN